ncbi:MAG: hypothetical protein LAN70_02610 [Acidobacteriia bacterium]|nr:hypothetical protein [Terriglobia bacterium]
MDASSIYSRTLSQLDATELSMTSPQGDALIQAASPADHQRAVQLLLDVHEARLALGNATLQSIADKLKANEQAIVAGTAAVQAALKALDNLTQILNTVSNLIGIVAQIVPMI